jgi:hypothetical protein
MPDIANGAVGVAQTAAWPESSTAHERFRHTFVARWTLAKGLPDEALNRLVRALLGGFSDADRAVYRPGAGIADREDVWLSVRVPAATPSDALVEANGVVASHLETVLGTVPGDLRIRARA